MGKMKQKFKENEYLRMIQWLILAVILYCVAAFLAMNQLAPQGQIATWKAANLTMAAYFGYWFDRTAFRGRINADTEIEQQVRRAIMIGATIIATALAV